MTHKKSSTPPKNDANARNWKFLCSALLQERDELRSEMTQLREENNFLKKSLGSLLAEEIVIDKETLLKQCRNQPSMSDLIEELEAAGD